MDKYDVLNLYEHNAKASNKIKEKLKEDDIVALVHATGTGKSYIILNYLLENKNKKTLYLVPANSISEHIEKIIEENPYLDRKKDFPNLFFKTYQSLINLSIEEISTLDIDTLIVDEFHHLGAPIWGKIVDLIIQTHLGIKVIGMTAYTVRDRGTIYERDMTNPDTDELFSNQVISRYDLCDAIIDGVLPKPIYKSTYAYLIEKEEYLESKLEKKDHNSKEYQELSKLLKDIKRRIHEALSIKDVFKQNIKKDGKYIYFCPIQSEEKINNIEDIIKETKKWLYEMGLTDNDFEFYLSTSNMGKLGKLNRESFYNDLDLQGNNVSNKLRIMFAKNQYNEGVHAPGLDGVIMGRTTKSDIVFFEHLGRALSVRGDTKKEYDNLSLKSIEELKKLCENRNIPLKDDEEKEEIIEKLIAPVIIDLVGNIEFIKELENDLKNRIKEITKNETKEKRKIHIKDASFDIEILNEDLYEILRYVKDRLTMDWIDYYELAKKYYEHYNNLEIPQKFKTIDGINYDEFGVKLGAWLDRQKQAYNGFGTHKITEEQASMLKLIGIDFDTALDKWYKNYELMKKYYEHYGNTNIPKRFKTLDGINYDEKGVSLGLFKGYQKQAYRNQTLSKEKIDLLNEIGFDFTLVSEKEKWFNGYSILKNYCEHYGKYTAIPNGFKTKDGINYDESGISLLDWFNNQKRVYKKGKLTEEQVTLLKNIGVSLTTMTVKERWQRNYELAKKYYEHYGNVNFPKRFKTLDGINYDKDGVNLNSWVGNMQVSYKIGTLSEEQINMAKKIGIKFNEYTIDEVWNKNYELAKEYYKYHGNLKVPQKFKTKNGYIYDEDGTDLGTWIATQRKGYKGQGQAKISTERINLLNQIGMIWFNEKTDDKLQNEPITKQNNKRKKQEILNRVITYLELYDDYDLPSKEDIDSKFIDELNHKNKL